MFNKILIANRGEIALRIIRTCREMKVQSVAVYSEIDASSPFVYHADEAWPLQGKTSRESYLQGKKIIEIAKKSGAEAIHPGYGFLSENADFADAVEKAGLVFIGPKGESIRTMGNKTAARKLMIAHNVPTVPGTEDAISDQKAARSIANDIGYPILIKAAAGGGGKGMRLVHKDDDFEQALQSAAREAQAAFNDDAVYIEKFVEQPRHIEFQILADAHGNIVHLGERECSVQRRHQKVIEEAPSALLDKNLREKMGQAAINAARACNYQNAGTIEFLVDKNRNFYFLEMNTRLQVEHPVTELTHGLDLVEEQLHIACGEKLRIKKSSTSFWGHAFECRLYAEDAANNWAPSPGKIEFLNPASGPGIREDSGIVSGSEISLYYDPLISKLCAWGKDRTQAINRMHRALSEYEIIGIKTSVPFLKKIFEHPAFKKGQFTTHFIDQYKQDLIGENKQLAEIASIAAIMFINNEKKKVKLVDSAHNGRSFSKWKSIHRKSNME